MTFWVPTPSGSDPNAFVLKATKPACVGPADHQFFMGGVAMAAGIHALEQTMGKPLLWATIQFISHGMLGDTIDLCVNHLGGGRSIAQTAASLKVGDRLLQHMVGAFGGRAGNGTRQFIRMPDVPKPEDCPPKAHDDFAQPDNLLSQFDRRVAFQDDETGLEYLWMRPVFETDINSGLLALMSDFLLGAHPQTQGGTSLDNTFRLNALTQTRWVLLVTQLSGFTNGAVHGTQHQFAEDGTLLSTSSQTGVLPRR